MAKKKPVVCAYCGRVTTKPTRDHVVPSTLWGGKGSRPPFPVIVPACAECQATYDSDAEYFRNCITTMMHRNVHPVAERLLTGPVTRSLERSQRATAELFKGLRVMEQRTPSGVITGSELGFALDVGRMNRIIEKIIRGLYYYKSRMKFPDSHSIHVFIGNHFWEDDGFQKLLAAMTPAEHQGDNVFSFRYVRDQKADMIAWLFIFYANMGFFAWTQPKALSRVSSTLINQ